MRKVAPNGPITDNLDPSGKSHSQFEGNAVEIPFRPAFHHSLDRQGQIIGVRPLPIPGARDRVEPHRMRPPGGVGPGGHNADALALQHREGDRAENQE